MPTTGEAWSRTPRYSPTSDPSARLPRGLQGLGAVNSKDLQSVCEAYLRTANAWDTRFDRDPSDAGARAAKYAVGPLRTGLLARQTGGGSGAFLTARDAGHGYSTVTSLIPVDGDAAVRGDIGSCGFEVVTSVMNGTGKKKVAADSDVLSTLTARRQPSGAWLITDEEVD